MKPKAIVIRVGGTNCDKETVNALNISGFDTKLVHINEIIRKEVDILNFNLLVIPGGFSFGDYISAGKIFAVELYYKLKTDLRKFISNKKNYIIGICNGFQVLAKLGLIPQPTFKQQITLTYNNSEKFECRWVYLKVNKNNPSVLKNLPDIIELPVAHAEGKFFCDKDTLNYIVKNNLNLFEYCDKNGSTDVNYPFNPNGSLNNIAAITDPTGHIIGLMPHPERFIINYQYPLFQLKENIIPYGRLFFNLIKESIL